MKHFFKYINALSRTYRYCLSKYICLKFKKKKAKTVSTVSERSKTKFSVSPEQKQKLLLNSKYPGFLSNTFSAHYL